MAVIKVVADLEAAWDAEDFEAALVALGADLEVTADAVATGAGEVATVVRLLEVSMTALGQPLPLRHRIPLPTTLHLEER